MSLSEILAQTPGDLELQFGGDSSVAPPVRVHKAFLSVASSVFSAAFSSETAPCTSMKASRGGRRGSRPDRSNEP